MFNQGRYKWDTVSQTENDLFEPETKFACKLANFCTLKSLKMYIPYTVNKIEFPVCNS